MLRVKEVAPHQRASGAIVVALSQQSQHGVHHAILSLDVVVAAVDRHRGEFGDTYFLYVGMVPERLFDILHVGTAAGEDNASEQAVVVFIGNLIPGILYDFLQASFHNLDEAAALNLPVLVDGVFQGVVDLVVVGICRGILQLHLLGVAFFHLQRGNVFGNVSSAEGYDGQVAQYVLGIDADGGGVGSQVDEHAARASL